MHIAEVTFRNRNDFHFKAYCRHCQKTSMHGDGYADAFYQTKVFPDRCCEHCGLNEYGESADDKKARLAVREPA
jgi:hypothetical protein